jgi:hypothetical protein
MRKDCQNWQRRHRSLEPYLGLLLGYPQPWVFPAYDDPAFLMTSYPLQKCGSTVMWSELRELAWLVSIIGGLSIASVAFAVALMV